MHHRTFQFECLDLWSLGFLSRSLMNSGCDWCSESSQAPALLFCCFVSAEELGKPLCSFCLKIGLRTRNHDDALARNICCWFFVLENQSYFAHSFPCSPCVVLLDKRAITAPEGLIITLCCSSRATNPDVSWPIYLDPSIHQKQKPEGNVCFPFRDCQWLGRWDGEGCARTHRQALLHRCPSQKELKLI